MKPIDDNHKVRCDDCDWTNDSSELICTDEDFMTKQCGQIDFNLCPNCGGGRITDIED